MWGLHVLVVLVLEDRRRLMGRGIADLNPGIVTIVVVVLVMLTVVRIMFHSYVAHHIVQSLPNFLCEYPTHINKKPRDVLMKGVLVIVLMLMPSRLSSVVLNASGDVHA